MFGICKRLAVIAVVALTSAFPATATGQTTSPETATAAPWCRAPQHWRRLSDAVFADAYRSSCQFCRTIGVRGIAREYGSRQHPLLAALAYAEQTYRHRYQQAGLEGCLRGFNAR